MAGHSGGLELTWTDKDKAILSVGDGKYDYTFVDPADYRVSEVRLLQLVDRCEAPTPSERPAGLPTPTEDNLLIVGDAMHVLDVLNKVPEFSERYLGKVKLVYIDPPFNTGRIFSSYEDNITHSIWLTLLRDRLRQIVPLLSDDGSVWVHLDDEEVHRCRLVMDEEFGVENFVGTVIWGKADTSRNDAKQFSTDQDYLLVYSKASGWRPNRLPRSALQDAIYSSPDGDPQPWLAKPGHAPGAKTHPGMVYAVQSPFTGEYLYPPPSGCWRLGAERMFAALNEWAPYKRAPLDDADVRARICDLPVDEMRNVDAMVIDVDLSKAQEMAAERQTGVLPEVYFVAEGSLLQVKGYRPEGLVPRTFWPFKAVGSNRNSKAETKRLFPGETPFDTPKPERLIQRVLHLATNPGDIVLDCFAGSGTTAAVAHKMGRRWVTSELLDSNVVTYVKPRLINVVHGRDNVGGATAVRKRAAADGVTLPPGVQPEDAHAFQRILRKVLDAREEAPPTEDDDDVDPGEVAEPFEPPPPLTISLDQEVEKVLRAAKKAGTNPLDDDEARSLRSLLRKLADAEVTEIDVTDTVRTSLLRRTSTRDQTTTLWHGGGSFIHLRVGPSMFEDVEGVVVLAEWATRGELAHAMCAQLEVWYEPNGIFAGRRGDVRYVVIDGLVGEGTVASILDQVPLDEIVEVWATQYDDAAVTTLRAERPGSRLEAIPDSVLDAYRRKARTGFPFRRRPPAIPVVGEPEET